MIFLYKIRRYIRLNKPKVNSDNIDHNGFLENGLEEIERLCKHILVIILLKAETKNRNNTKNTIIDSLSPLLESKPKRV